MVAVQAQGITEAYRYSQFDIPYSARTMGMGGTMSAIGADPVAVLLNPAGLGNFRRSEFQISLYNRSFSSDNTYFGTASNGDGSKFSMPNVNIVIPKIRYDRNGRPAKKGLVSTAWNFGINKVTDFTENYSFQGNNTSNSITDHFATDANSYGYAPNDLEGGYLDYIAYNAGAIAYNSSTGQYVSAYDSTDSDFDHIGSVKRKGNKYSYSFGIGANFDYKFQIGASVSYNTIRFTEDYYLEETDLRSNQDADIEQLFYRRKFFDKGNGLGINLGAIVDMGSGVKLGFGYNSGITYNLKTSFGYDLTTVLDDKASPVIKSLREFTDPDNTYDYNITTPATSHFGLNWMMDKRFMFNADFSYLNYRKSEFYADDASYDRENIEINNLFRATIISRFGMEYNHPMANNKDQTLRLRLGYINQPSGYNRSVVQRGSLLTKSKSIVSAGIGIIDKDFYLDAAIQYSNSYNYFLPYYTEDEGLQGMENQLKLTIFQITAGFKI